MVNSTWAPLGLPSQVLSAPGIYMPTSPLRLAPGVPFYFAHSFSLIFLVLILVSIFLSHLSHNESDVAKDLGLYLAAMWESLHTWSF